MTAEQEMQWIYCNHCRTKTRHVCVGSKDYHSEEDGPGEWGTYRLWTCAGCDTCTMGDNYSADYMRDQEDEEYYESVFHPKRAHSVRSEKHFIQLPHKLKSLYKEIITSHNESLNLLCAAGLRALIEGACADKGIAGRNLEEKIEGMKKLLPENIVKNLHSFRFIGNRAVHELEPPSNLEVTLALNVIEDILNFLYELDYKAKMLDDVRSARGGSSSSSGTKTVADAQSKPDNNP